MSARTCSKRKNADIFVLLLVGLVVFASALFWWSTGAAQSGSGYAQQVVLAYDDGVPDLNLTFLENAGTVFAVRFTPPSAGGQLVELRYFTPDTSKGASFNLTVAKEAEGEPGESLLGPIPIKVNAPGWNAIELADRGLQVEGDFFVLFEYDGHARLTLGAEDRPPLFGRTYDTDC